ncbi:tRNA epoxyqueuosine(34) reductase QueG [Marivibrio halodurans]|uniref:Epoxyqueuosine reductase n=1 Tax=Marivibrio halodurans TaxID=2039722 RepID=A0A8J7V367_9PROT|nr:tRNA epoxyqueuosine(34) reductase QueG [Marivibrio halodurans]MBP5857906.1 tRNA epoxyqueuosine(34) reductase QueG [Marivibrio halodurans]
MTDDDRKQAITDRALAEGFSVAGVAPARVGPREQARLDTFVANGEHGEMGWMADTLARRRDPRTLWPEVESVLVLGLNYGPESNPMTALRRRDRANISAYARNRDYHDLIKKRLKRIARWMVETYGCRVKVFVDTAPVMEKPLAALTRVGWQGKHSNLVSRDLGSWLFLGEIFTDMALPPDSAEGDHCGGCRRCLDICPTDAFPAPYTLDATRCISYLTIEHKGPIPHEFREAMGNRIYGCDDCLAICPWNKFAVPTEETAFLPRPGAHGARLEHLLTLDDAAFRALFTASPVKRIGRDRFLRNVLIACGNSGEESLAPPVERLLEDAAPVVRGAAVWALSKLAPARCASLAGKREAERDADVIEEWARALG